MLNKNERHKNEDRLVTDERKLYRIAPHFAIPKGLREVFDIQGRKVYQSNGKLMPALSGAQKIQPRNNIKYLARCIQFALYGEVNQNVG